MEEVSGTYNLSFVVIAILIAILASYIALDMCAKLSRRSGAARIFWLVSGSFVMALGIWAMHFIAMLAFKLPAEVFYDAGLVILSIVFAWIGTSIAFFLSARNKNLLTIIIGSICMGAAISSMHYIGMMAMEFDGMMHHGGIYYYLSIAIAIIASCVSLLLFDYFKTKTGQKQFLFKLLSAVMMGAAVCGMHFTAMQSMVYHVNASSLLSEPIFTQNNINLAITVMLVILLVQVLAFVSTSTDQKLADQAEKLHHIANHDALTGIPNRRFFEEQLFSYLSNRKREEEAALFFMDLDRFKSVNDTLGHKTGDKLLKLVAQRLKEILPARSMIARLGGDEFTLLFPCCSKQEASILAEDMINLLEKPFVIEGKQIKVSTSIGIALIPIHGNTSKELMRFADIAMYLAKEGGRSQYRFFADNMAEGEQQILMETGLSFAIENGQIQVYLQPKVDSAEEKVIGMEALCRWVHPEYGIIPPAKFIPIAEKNGTIIELDKKMIQLVFEAMSKPPFANSQLQVAVNISTQQFYNNRFVAFIKEQMRNYPEMDVSRLEIEITEETAIHNVRAAAETIQELKALGIKIALDDFGNGFNSLSYLKQLPVDTLKIDRSFITNLPADVQDQAIVTSIVTLAKKLNLQIVAEGIENREQFKYIQMLNCDYAQGYMFSKPLQLHDFVAFTEAHKKGSSAIS